MTDIRTPRTPLHPAPNEEVSQLPNAPMADEMDLNPELYDDEDVAVGIGRGNTIVIEEEVRPNGENSQLVQEQGQEQVNEIMSDEESEMEEVDVTNKVDIILLTPDFDEYMSKLNIAFDANKEAQLSASQQSNLVMYLDDSILKVHRKFIKSQVNEEMTYPINDLIGDLTSTLDVLWLSVNSRNKLIFQGEYLIKVLGDMLDFIENYRSLIDPHKQHTFQSLTADLEKIFQFFQALDARIAFLMDGYSIEGSLLQKLSGTQVIRVVPIATRLRMAVISKMELVRHQLVSLPPDQQAISNLIDIEVSKLFEGILDRS